MAAIDAPVGRHVVVVSSRGDDHVPRIRHPVVGRVVAHPSVRPGVDLHPGMALGRLLASEMQVAAHVATRDAPQPQQRQHHVGEILTHAGARLDQVVAGAAPVGHVPHVAEALVDEASDLFHLYCKRLGLGHLAAPARGLRARTNGSPARPDEPSRGARRAPPAARGARRARRRRSTPDGSRPASGPGSRCVRGSRGSRSGGRDCRSSRGSAAPGPAARRRSRSRAASGRACCAARRAARDGSRKPSRRRRTRAGARSGATSCPQVRKYWRSTASWVSASETVTRSRKGSTSVARICSSSYSSFAARRPRMRSARLTCAPPGSWSR